MAAAVMPIIAQNFVDSRSNSSFNLMVATGNNNNIGFQDSGSDDPPRELRQIAKMPTRASREKDKDLSPTGEHDTRGSLDARNAREKAEADGIYYWPDDTFLNKFFFVDEVGFGNWGSLWLSYVEPDRQNAAAVKVVHRLKDTSSAARVKALWNEYKCIRALRATAHPNLIAFHAFILTPSFAVVCMDYHPSLITVSIPESRVKVYGRQLLSAVEHLHVHGITHNDIKPANILLAADDRPVLIDFGFAQQWNTRSPDRFLSSLSWGTVEYLSPERAQGQLHDERLSDVWALGITLYELVVGRTPFEENEEETVLDRAQLERYYQRTLTGEFYGDYIVSTELENLVRLMTEANPGLRLQSCGKALQHRFFDLPPSRLDESSSHTLSLTPNRSQQGTSTPKNKTPTSTSSGKKPLRSTPRKQAEKGFAIFQDEDIPSPARIGRSVSPFSPRSKPLGNATNRSPVVHGTHSECTPVLSSKTPTRSRIPVRKPKPIASSSVVPPREGSVFVADDTAPVPPIPCSHQLASEDKPAKDLAHGEPPAKPAAPLNRSTSVTSVRRKPVPTLFDESYDLADQSFASTLEHQADRSTDRESEEEILSSNRTSPVDPVFFDSYDSQKPSELSSSLGAKTSRFLRKSFTRKTSATPRSIVTGSPVSNEVAFPKSSTSPQQRQLSKSLNGRVRKLSTPLRHIHRPSVGALSGLKRSISAIARRRASSTDSSYSLVEPETLRAPRTTTPVRVQSPACVDADAQRARLAAFSAHVQQILEVRNSMETARNDEHSPAREETPPPSAHDEGSTSLGSIKETSADRSSREKKQQGSSPPSSKRSFLRRKSSRSLRSQLSSSPTVQRFKPGHRRIPTAIRNVPSVVLHESGDDPDCEVDSSGCMAVDGLGRGSVASPPPPPRVVEASRRLPTWVVDDSDGDEESSTDRDEPTITIGMTPRHGKSIHKMIIEEPQGSDACAETARSPISSRAISSLPIALEDQRVTRIQPFESLVSDDRLFASVTSEPPFQNLESRSETRASSTRSPSLHHSRSHSVLSFFTGTTSRVSNAASDDRTTLTQKAPPKVKKTMRRIRRVVSKVFG